ncbi:MAG: T9SS type A sorting domain-containing protein, partial [Candidatus Dadabacteria bacterium]
LRVRKISDHTCASSASCMNSSNVVPSRKNTQEDFVETQKIVLPGAKPSVVAYPNPYNDKIRFIVITPEAGKGSLELYNLLGQKIRTVYQGSFNEGTQTFEISIPVQQRSTLIYIVSLNGRQVSGKLLNGTR